MNILKCLLALTTWNAAFEASPAGTDGASLGDDKITELKGAVRERVAKEHVMDTSAGTLAADGWHKSGSARVYTGTTNPTTKPDGVTALDTNDTGRQFYNTTSHKLYTYVHGTGWVLTGLEEPPIGTVYIQFPGKTAPATLYGGTWSNISSSFAGSFFRSEGVYASAFGSGSQAGSIAYTYSGFSVGTIHIIPRDYFSVTANYDTTSSSLGNIATVRFTNTGSYTEDMSYTAYLLRPVNLTIRLWERTA